MRNVSFQVAMWVHVVSCIRVRPILEPRWYTSLGLLVIVMGSRIVAVNVTWVGPSLFNWWGKESLPLPAKER